MLRLIYLSTSFLIYNYYYKLIFFKPLCHILHGLHIYGIIHNKENTTFIFPFKNSSFFAISSAFPLKG